MVGYNFGSSASFISVFRGTAPVKLLYMESLDADHCGPSIISTFLGSCAGLALMFYEGVSHLGKIFRVVVNDQSSEYPDGNSLSKSFLLRHGHPVIYAVDLGTNTRTAGGYLIELRGKNFGQNKLSFQI